MLCVWGGMFLLQNQAALPADTEPTAVERTMELELIELMNEMRIERNLKPLKENPILAQVARAKSEQMRMDDLFAHINPTFGDPFSMMEESGLHFVAAGENLAHAHYTAMQSFADWMDSYGHRNNILSPVFEDVGVGLAPDRHGGWLWTVLFMQEE
ncbi:MAG: CAP domain-containing protein [Oscillospiraceae bacterium]|nr:CAP domain-containing protein [Oscillospiraceae bacterium]